MSCAFVWASSLCLLLFRQGRYFAGDLEMRYGARNPTLSQSYRIQRLFTGYHYLTPNKLQFGWYSPCLAVINAHTLVTPDTNFSNISWNWPCYQRAFSAIYQNYFWKFTLFADAILLQICLYSHMPSSVWIVWNTNEILHIVQSVALGVCFSINYSLEKTWSLNKYKCQAFMW